jgi:hypothetical protein
MTILETIKIALQPGIIGAVCAERHLFPARFGEVRSCRLFRHETSIDTMSVPALADRAMNKKLAVG